MINKTYGTMYYVTNMKQAIEFYRKTLGVKPSDEGETWTEFDFGGHKLCLHATKPEETYPLNGILILNTDGVKSIFEKWKGDGLNVFNLHEVHPGAWTFHLRDHNGNEHSIYGAP